jgi:hypothetical protein
MNRGGGGGIESSMRNRAVLLSLLLLVMGAAVAAQSKLPESPGAPKAGQKAPDFSLPDQNNKPLKLSALLAESKAAADAPAVLLIFYRGYW